LFYKAPSHDKHVQRQVPRVEVLITTRCNWQRDAPTLERTEIARPWSVTNGP
jgi:hypothetical protein